MKEVFPITPAANGPIVLFAIIVAFLLGLCALFGWLAWSSRNATVVLQPDSLAITGVMYGRSVPITHLKLDAAQALDMRQGEYRLGIKTNGAGLPGFAAGWFRTVGGVKVLAFITNPARVVWIPTTEGYTLALGVDEPDRLLARLRDMAG